MRGVLRVLAAASVAVVLGLAHAPLEAQQAARATPIPDAVIARAQTFGSARVIVNLRTGFVPEGRLDSAAAVVQRRSIATVQSAVMTRLAAFSPRRVRRFAFIPAVAGELSLQAIQALRTMPEVESIEEDVLDRPTLADSVRQINVPAAWSSGYTGVGWAVAILDTGVQTDHPFLSGATVAEACYSNAGGLGAGTALCPGGVASSTVAGSGVNCSIAAWGSGCDHGTHVAGIAAGRTYSGGPGYNGVAKGASIIPIQVFTGMMTGTSADISSYASDQLAALQRVQALAVAGMHIAAVNMSLGGRQYADRASCDTANPSRKNAIDSLRSMGIAVVIASGNEGSKSSVSAPGCISSAISVGSVNDLTAAGLFYGAVDSVSYFSNSASFLGLLAPGFFISSSVPADAFATHAGTSMAAPHVAGAWALMKQRKPTASVPEVLAAFTATGVAVTMPGGTYAKPRIDVHEAINAVRVDYMEIDGPKSNTSIAQPFTASGWALHMSALSDTGVDAVHLYAFPRPALSPAIFLGVATYGGARVDVGGIFGSPFTNSAWNLTVSGLAAGAYDINAYARNTFTGTFSQVSTATNVTVTIPSGPRMSIDTPMNGAIVPEPFLFGGWALDRGAAPGTTGIDAVHVYAFPRPGSGAPPTFVGTATIGVARPDVGAVFGSQFTNAGWAIPIAALTPGPYLLAAYGHDQVTGDFAVVQSINLTIPGPLMSVDVPSNRSAQSQPFSISGWAIDRGSWATPGVDAIHVWAYPEPGSSAPAQFVGVGTYGGARADVGDAYGSQFTNSGYTLTVSGLAPGHAYRLAVYAHSSVTGTFNQVRLVDVAIP